MALSRSLGVFFSFMVLAAMAVNSVDAITCNTAIVALRPCLPFLTGQAPSPPTPCCLAVANINSEASTKEDRQELCECFKKNAPAFGVKADRASHLPQLCHVAVPVPIVPTIDCKTIP